MGLLEHQYCFCCKLPLQSKSYNNGSSDTGDLDDSYAVFVALQPEEKPKKPPAKSNGNQAKTSSEDTESAPNFTGSDNENSYIKESLRDKNERAKNTELFVKEEFKNSGERIRHIGNFCRSCFLLTQRTPNKMIPRVTDALNTSISKVGTLSPMCEGIRTLFQSYEPHYWYWEIVEIIRRLLLTAVVSVMLSGTSTQLVICVAISVFFTVHFIHIIYIHATCSNRFPNTILHPQ